MLDFRFQNSIGELQYACEQVAATYGWGCEPGPPCHCQPHSCDEPTASPCGCANSLRQSQLKYACETAVGTRLHGYEYPPPPPQQFTSGYCHHHDAEPVAERPCDCNGCPRSPKHLSRDELCPCECSLPSESAVVPVQLAPQQQQPLEYPCDRASHVVDETSRCGYPAHVRQGRRYSGEQEPPYRCYSPGTECVTSRPRDGGYFGTSRALQDERSLDRPSRESERERQPRFTSEIVPAHTPVTRKVRFFEEIINDGSKNHSQVSERKITEVCEMVEERSHHVSTQDINEEEEFTSSFQNRQGFTTFSSLANESGTSHMAPDGLLTQTLTGISQRRSLESNPSSPLNTEATDSMIVHSDNHSIDWEDSKKLVDFDDKKYKVEEVWMTHTKQEADDSPRSRSDDPKEDDTSHFQPTDGVNGAFRPDGSFGDGCRSCLSDGGAEHVTRLCTRLQSVTLNRRQREENIDADEHETLPKVHSEQAAALNTDNESISIPAAVSTQVVIDRRDITEKDARDPWEISIGEENSGRDPVATTSVLHNGNSLPLLELQEEDVASQVISIGGNDVEEKAPTNKRGAQVDQLLKQPVARHKQQNFRSLRNTLGNERHEICKPNAPGKSVKRNHDDVVPTFRNLDKPKDPYANDGQNQYKYKSKINFSNYFESDLDTDDKDIHIVYQRNGTSTERKEIEKLNHDVTELKIKLNELQFRQLTVAPVTVPKKVIKKTVKKLSPRKRSLKKRKVTSLGVKRFGSSLDEVCAGGKNTANMHNMNAKNSNKKTPESSIPHNNTVENNAENGLSKTQYEIPSPLIATLPDMTNKDVSIRSNGKSCNASNEQKQKQNLSQKTCQVGATNSIPKPNYVQQMSKAGKRDECEKKKKRGRESNESNASLESTIIVLASDPDDVLCGEERAQTTASDHLFAKSESNRQDKHPEINITLLAPETILKNQSLQNSSTILQMENQQEPVEVSMKSPTVSTNVVSGLTNICNKVGGSSKVSTGTRKSSHIEPKITEKQHYNNTASKHDTNESSSLDVQTFVVPFPVNNRGTAQAENTPNKTKPISQTILTKPPYLFIDLSEDTPEVTGNRVIAQHPTIESSGNGNPTKVKRTESGTTNGNSSNKQHLPGQPILKFNTDSTATSSTQQKRGPAASNEQNAENGHTLVTRQVHLKQQASNSSTVQRQTNAEPRTLVHKTPLNAMQSSGLVCREQLTHRVNTSSNMATPATFTNTARNPHHTPLVTTAPENQTNEMISYVTSAFPHPYGFVSVQNPNIQFLPPNNLQVPIGYMQPPPMMFQNPQQFSQYLPFQPINNAPTCNYENMHSSVDIDGNVFISTPSYAYNPSFTPVITPYPHINDGASFTRLLQEQQQFCADTSSSAREKSVSQKTVPSKRDVDTLKYPGSIFMASGLHSHSSQSRGFLEQDPSNASGAALGFTQIRQPPLNAPFINANRSGSSVPTNQPLPSPAVNMPSININRAERYQQRNQHIPASAVNMQGVKATSQQNPLPLAMNMQRAKETSQQTNHALPSSVNMQARKSTCQQTNNSLQPPAGNMQSVNINSQPINRPLQSSAATMHDGNSTSQPNSNPKLPSTINMQGSKSTSQSNNNTLQPSDTIMQDRNSTLQPNNSLQPSFVNMHGSNSTYKTTSHPLLKSTANIHCVKTSSQPSNCAPLPSAATMQDRNSASQLTNNPKLPSAANMQGGNSNCSDHYETARKSILTSTIAKQGEINSKRIFQQKANQNNSVHSKQLNQPSLSSLTIRPPHSRVNLNKTGRSKSLHLYKPSSLRVESARSNMSSNSEPNKGSLPSSSSNKQGLDSKSLASFEAIGHAPLDLMKEHPISDVPNTRKKAPTQLMLSAVLKRQGIKFKGDASCQSSGKPTHLESFLSNNNKNVIPLSSSSGTSSSKQSSNKSKNANNVPKVQQSTGKEDGSFRNKVQQNGTQKKCQIQKDVGKKVTMPRGYAYKTATCDKSNTTMASKEDSRLFGQNLNHRTTSSFSSETMVTRRMQARSQSQGGETLKSHVPSTKRNASCLHAPKPDLVSTVKRIEKGTYSSEKDAIGDKSCRKDGKMHLPVKAIPIRDPMSTNRKVMSRVVGKKDISTEKRAPVHGRVMSRGERKDKSEVIRTQINTKTREQSEREGEAGVISTQYEGDCDGDNSKEGVVKSKASHRDCDKTNTRDKVVKPKLSHRDCDRVNSKDGVKSMALQGHRDNLKAGGDIPEASQGICDETNSRDGVTKYTNTSQRDCSPTALPILKIIVKKYEINSKEPLRTDQSDLRVEDKQLEEEMRTCSNTSSTPNKESLSPSMNRPSGRSLDDSEASDYDSANNEEDTSRRRSQSPNKNEGRKKSKYRQRSSWGYWYNRRGISQKTVEHMDDLCTEIWNDCNSVEFRLDVDFKHVVDYVSIVKQPLCLKDIRSKLKRYAYRTVDQFVHDLRRLIFNSRLYNPRNSELGKVTTSLETKINKLVYDVFECNFNHITGDPLERETNPDLKYTFYTGL